MFLALVASLCLQSTDFSPATPESQGLEPAWLERLGGVVQGYVDAQEIVGAELLVIRNDHVVLHRGYGWRHREEQVSMEPGGVFCLRSMTKAVVGTAAQMLIDGEELDLDAPVADVLPEFANERSRAITVQHLLEHTSGLPLSGLLGGKLAELGGERDIAALAGERGPDFAPGTRYQYSDDGADTLGALIEAASGQGLEDFLRARILAPLGMRETTGVMSTDHPLRPRVCSNYAGGPGAWTRYWSPRDPPLFPFLLGSQALYGTALDYARFLRLWKEKGRAGSAWLLSQRAVRRALEPLHEARMPSGFERLQAYYGQMMQLWVDPEAGERERVVAFGHGGSDGTMAWVFPALDLMVLYFTQSRNSLTVIEFGAAVQRCLLDPLTGTARAGPVAYTEGELEAFAGFYWEEDDQEYQAVLRRGDALLVEFPGKSRVELAPTSERDVFRFRLSAEYRLEFERDEQGAVVAFTGVMRGKSERMPRLFPAADLPGVEELLARKRSASDWTRLATLGPVRFSYALELPGLGLSGEVVSVVDGARRRSDTEFGTSRETTLACDGRAWTWSSRAALEELSGQRLSQAVLDHPYLPAADWRQVYERVEVVGRAVREGKPAILVRATPRSGNAHTWSVDAESGLPLELFSIEELPGLGEVGSVTRLDDWREVGGLVLPFRSTFRFSSSLLGSGEQRCLAVESGVTLAVGTFEPAALGEAQLVR